MSVSEEHAVIDRERSDASAVASPDIAFASHASREFNERLGEVIGRFTEDTKAALGDNLFALVLGGGYGRSEGGVLVVDGVEKPYNDLDFTLVVRDKRTVPFARLDEISEKYEHEIGIHVDFSRPLSAADVRSLPHWLMSKF